MNISKSQPRILWVQVLALAGVQGAITLTWLVYNIYLPQLLTQFGFPASLAVGLLVVENALGVVLEPLMGGLSDHAIRWLGSRFPFISVGVILASSLFIAIPCIVTFIPPIAVIKGILPLVLIAWALAMTVFRSPAISLLARYSMPKELPLAVSFVTLAGGIVGAFRGVANTFILSLGPIAAFSIASFVLLGAVFTLRFFNPPETPENPENIEIPKIPIGKLALILVTGFSMAWGSRLLMDTIGKILKTQLQTNNISGIMLGIGLILAIAALPAGFLAVKFGNRQAMLAGIFATILSLILMLNLGVHFLIVLLTLAGLSLILNGVIPYALELMPPKWAGLGTGMYFGGFSLAMSLFGFVFPATITSLVAGISSIFALLLASMCIIVSEKYIAILNKK